MLRNRNINNKNSKKNQKNQQNNEIIEKNKNKSINDDFEDDEYSEDDEILKDLNECKTQNQIKRQQERDKELEKKENNFFQQIIAGLFEHNYISSVVIFNYSGIVIASKNLDTSKFPKQGIDLHRYFERTPLGSCANRDVVSQCGRDLLGPGYIVEGVSKNSIYCFNNETKSGFSLEKTKSTFILGCFNEKQNKFDAYSTIGSLADDFRGIQL